MKFSHIPIAATLIMASLAGIGSVAVANSKADARNLIAVTEVPVTHDHAVSIALQTIPAR